MTLDVLIPARGNSKRLTNKNILPVGGVPLLARAIDLCRQLVGVREISVSSDSPEILDMARQCGATPLSRPPELAEDHITVDQVVVHHHIDDSPLLVYQPTVVGLSSSDLQLFVDVAASSKWASAIATPIHGIWDGVTDQFDHRLNAQYAEGPYQEIGVRYYPTPNGHGAPEFIRPLDSFLDSPPQVVDIDTPTDYLVAQSLVSARHIVIRYAYSTEVGSGHYRRALAIAERLQHHHVSLHNVDGEGVSPSTWHNFPALPIDLIINDCLDTTEAEMAELRRSAPVIAFEDLGSGARLANAVVNDLYPTVGQYGGHRYSILRPEFLITPPPLSERTTPVVVSFGGTDPNDLTGWLHHLLGPRAIYVYPPGRAESIRDYEISPPSMAALLSQARTLITSAGRTVYEAAALGVPTFIIAQNPREATHQHLGPAYGNHFFGLYPFVTDHEILNVLNLSDHVLSEMSVRAYATMDRRGLDRVIGLIETTLLEHS